METSITIGYRVQPALCIVDLEESAQPTFITMNKLISYSLTLKLER